MVVTVSSEDALPYGVAGAIAVGARFSRVGLALSLRGSGRREPHNYLGVLRSWTVAPWVEGRRTRLAGRGGGSSCSRGTTMLGSFVWRGRTRK